jgi:orotate phosphoribosyltransferase
MSNTQQSYKISNFIHDIVSKNIVQFNKTELSCGRTSSYYADFRQLLGHPELTNYVVSQIIKIIETLEATGTKYDIIAGVAVAGVPWATLVGNKLNKPVSIIRLNEKTHGKKSAIDGAPIKFEDRVILIEDVLTTGGSVLKAIRKIINTGAEIVRVISLLDRNEGAQEHIKYYFPDIKISSILSIDTLVSVCSANKLIADYTAEQIEFYRESGYTETIKMLTKLNEDGKEREFQKDPVAWHISNYPDVWNLTPVTSIEDSSSVNNAFFVDVSSMNEWNEIKYKVNALGNKLHNLVIIFEKINDWNETKQEELITLQQKYGFNIIYKSHETIPQSLVIDSTTYTILQKQLYKVLQNCTQFYKTIQT